MNTKPITPEELDVGGSLFIVEDRYPDGTVKRHVGIGPTRGWQNYPTAGYEQRCVEVVLKVEVAEVSITVLGVGGGVFSASTLKPADVPGEDFTGDEPRVQIGEPFRCDTPIGPGTFIDHANPPGDGEPLVLDAKTEKAVAEALRNIK